MTDFLSHELNYEKGREISFENYQRTQIEKSANKNMEIWWEGTETITFSNRLSDKSNVVSWEILEKMLFEMEDIELEERSMDLHLLKCDRANGIWIRRIIEGHIDWRQTWSSLLWLRRRLSRLSPMREDGEIMEIRLWERSREINDDNPINESSPNSVNELLPRFNWKLKECYYLNDQSLFYKESPPFPGIYRESGQFLWWMFTLWSSCLVMESE